MEELIGLNSSERWHWRWVDLCGPGGFKIWSAKRHDLGHCFQQLCLQIPVFAFLACASSYYYGRRVDFVKRGSTQIIAINVRALVVMASALLPLLQIYVYLNKTDTPIQPVSYFLFAVEGIAWFSHLLYTFALKKRLGLSPRGPVVICVTWTLLFVLEIVSLRTHILIYRKTLKPDFSVFTSYGFSICSVLLQILYGITLLPGEGDTVLLDSIPREERGERQPLLDAFDRFLEETDPTYLGVAMDGCNWFSKLVFYWVNPLMEKGVRGKLQSPDDLFDLPLQLTCSSVSLKLDKALIGNVDEVQKKILQQRLHASPDDIPASSTSITSSPINVKKYNVSLLVALHKCFWFQFYSIGILKLIADCAGFAGPMLLNKLVSFIENREVEMRYGYGYAIGLCFTTLIAAFCNSHFNFLMAAVGLKIRASIVTAIYRKTLTVSSSVLNRAFSVGEITNFMSTDADRIVNSCPSFHAFWSIPLQVAVTLYLLYLQVGLAFVAGLAFSIVLIPINKYIANKIGQLSTKMMERKDARVKMMTEVLRGIKILKVHVWEEHFMKLITKLRDGELKYLKGRKYLDALCVYFWATTPVLISILTFGTYVLLGNRLTAATVFTSMALLNMLISPLNAFPWVLNGMTEALVSIKRIQQLLDLPDLDLDRYYSNIYDYGANFDLVVKDAAFNWGKSLSRQEREKLHSLKRETKGKGKGKKVPTGVNFTKQLEDVSKYKAGDDGYIFRLENINLFVRKGAFVGIVGKVGCGKSSLLAGMLAELTMEEGEVAVNDLQRGFGFVTQQPWLQRGTIRDNILFGKPYDETKYKIVLKVCGLQEDILLLPARDLTGVGDSGMTLSGGQKARIALARAVYQDKQIYLFDDIISAVDVKVAKHIMQQCIMGYLRNKTRILCTHHVNYLVQADKVVLIEGGTIKSEGKAAEVLGNIDDFLPLDLELASEPSSLTSTITDSIKSDEVIKDKDNVLNEENRECGEIRIGVYGSYWRAIGFLLTSAILLSLFLMQTSRNMSDWWLSYWVTAASENTTNVTVGVLHRTVPVLMLGDDGEDPVKHYLYVYIGFAVLNSLFTLFRAFLFAYGGIVAAAKIHKLLLRSIMNAKSGFFDVSPLGRILNRFSSDTYTVDDSLPFQLNILLAQLFGLLGSIIITIYGLPWLCLILVPLIPVYHWLQHHYRLTSRELKRLSSVTLSPVYSHFNESLQGLATIRALRATQRFIRDNEDNVEANVKAQFASQAAGQWLGLRLQFIGVAMVTGICFIAVVQHQYDVADPGLVGLAITYSLSVTSLLSGVVNAFTETEREMVAVERVNEYIEGVISEPTAYIIDPPYAWPSQGVVQFRNVVLKYREHLAPALKGVSFETRPAEKIGVVGRTGAGKSSLLTALFRLVELYAGSVTIDSVDISHISIAALRSRLWCIPQDPFLFSGSVRENLDPLGEFRDNEIWSALSKANLENEVNRMGGLDIDVGASGSRFSVGQKQLMCLARAILHNAKVLCVDEATANVDQETDHQIQLILRSAFRKSTVITIAHRVQTVLDCDRIMVMGDGQVLEFDTPDNLHSDPNSHFSQLINQE